MTNDISRLAALALSTLLLGCAASPTEQTFGQAVRATLAEQRVQPGPDTGAAAGMDGPRAEKVIGVYRDTVGNPADVVGGQVIDPQ